MTSSIHSLGSISFRKNWRDNRLEREDNIRPYSIQIEKKLDIGIYPINLVVNEVVVPPFARNIINKYEGIISLNKNTSKYYYSVYNRIDTGSHVPISAKARQLSSEKCKVARSEI